MSRKGDVEISEVFIVLILLVSVFAAVWIAGNSPIGEVEVTSKNTGEFVKDGLEEASKYFYRTHPHGDYNITTHIWSLGSRLEPPDSIPHSENMTIPDYSVFFDGRFLYDIRGFGAKVYERYDEVEPMAIEAVAVFLGTSETLDRYYENEETFMIRFYKYNTERRLLEDCIVHSYSDSMTENENLVRSYYIHCNIIWEGYFSR